jgi:hypothetical protein
LDYNWLCEFCSFIISIYLSIFHTFLTLLEVSGEIFGVFFSNILCTSYWPICVKLRLELHFVSLTYLKLSRHKSIFDLHAFTAYFIIATWVLYWVLYLASFIFVSFYFFVADWLKIQSYWFAQVWILVYLLFLLE